MAEAVKKEAKRVGVTLEDIKFNKDNAVLALLSCIPLVGAIVFFVEKKDLFVRYYAAQYGIVLVVGIVASFVLFFLAPLLNLGVFVLMVVGMMNAYKGERFDIPMVSKYALELMNRY